MTMRLILPLLLLLQAAGTDSDRSIQEILNNKYARKLLTVRDFPIGERFLFDADGKLLSGGTPGVFTLDGTLRVESVRVSSDRIEIRGRRAFLNYNSRTQKLEEFLSNEQMRLQFARKAGVPVEPGIDAALLPLERLAPVVPTYWKRFLDGNVGLQTVVDPATGVRVPRASETLGLMPRNVRQVTPEYPAILKPYGVTGSVLLHVIVDDSGKPTIPDIVEPAGFGLDQAAIEAVRQWEYEPARQEGKPVQVYFRVRVNFSPPR
jgi:TonB family protein